MWYYAVNQKVPKLRFLGTRIDTTFEVMYRRIDRLRRSFTPLVKLLSKKLFMPPRTKKKPVEKIDSKKEIDDQTKISETHQQSASEVESTSTRNRNFESQNSQVSAVSSSIASRSSGKKKLHEKRTQATDSENSEDSTSDYDDSFDSQDDASQDWAETNSQEPEELTQNDSEDESENNHTETQSDDEPHNRELNSQSADENNYENYDDNYDENQSESSRYSNFRNAWELKMYSIDLRFFDLERIPIGNESLFT